MPDHDVVVIGGGLAGSTAGLFAARFGLSTVVLNSGLPGGQLLNVGSIEDFPGFPDGVAGFELCPAVQEQALAAGATFEMSEAKELTTRDGSWTVATTGGEFNARAVIVATGSRAKTLGVPGEEQFAGMGVSHCASCDGPIFRGQTVAVVGGGDSALQESLELVSHVDKVLLFHRGETLTGQDNYRRRVLASQAIEVQFGTVVEEVLGEGKVTGLKVKRLADGSEEIVEVGALFVYIGGAPHTEFLGDLLPTDDHGRINTDAWMRTSLPGLLAAGDVRSESAAQAVTVAGDGATAAVSAHRYVCTGTWASSPGPHG